MLAGDTPTEVRLPAPVLSGKTDGFLGSYAESLMHIANLLTGCKKTVSNNNVQFVSHVFSIDREPKTEDSHNTYVYGL